MEIEPVIRCNKYISHSLVVSQFLCTYLVLNGCIINEPIKYNYVDRITQNVKEFQERLYWTYIYWAKIRPNQAHKFCYKSILLLFHYQINEQPKIKRKPSNIHLFILSIFLHKTSNILSVVPSINKPYVSGARVINRSKEIMCRSQVAHIQLGNDLVTYCSTLVVGRFVYRVTNEYYTREMELLTNFQAPV